METYNNQDSNIEFDPPENYVQECQGEQLLDIILDIEDTKGNFNERGLLKITNLRIIWQNHSKRETSLSIGYNQISNNILGSSLSAACSIVQNLTIKCSYEDSRYEFVFKSMNANHKANLFQLYLTIYNQYLISRNYREIKLKSAIFSTSSDINLIGSESLTLGEMIVTNIRMVWHSKQNQNNNISIPFIKVSSVNIKQTVHGDGVFIETKAMKENFIGFNSNNLDLLFQELSKFYHLSSSKPFLTPKFDVQSPPKYENKLQSKLAQDKTDFIKSDINEKGFAFQSYKMEGSGKGKDQIVFNQQLCMATQKLPIGVNINDIWNILDFN